MDKNMMEKLISCQYNLPTKLYRYAYRYKYVSFYQALALYRNAVEEVIILHDAEHLYDEPLSFGRGLSLATKLWLAKMDDAEKIKKNKLELLMKKNAAKVLFDEEI